MAQKRGIPDKGVPFVDKDGRITHEWLVFLQPLLTIDVLPAGALITWPTETPPDGWLERDGSSLSRKTYAALFAVIGTMYGTADGTHFNLPDDRGRFPRYWAHGSTNDPDRATRTAPATAGATLTAGDHVGTQQADQLKAHQHDHAVSDANWSFGAGGEVLYRALLTTHLSGSSGGNETRAINTYEMPLIKY